MRHAIRLAIIGFITLAAGSAFLAENALHIWNHPQPDPALASTIARQGAASWRSCGITAGDGVRLDAWLFVPRQANGAGVILLHGIADTRAGMTGHAPFLLRAGYTVLLPDSRAHGASGGGIVTYGVRESEDIHRWADMLLRDTPVQRLYGLGQSMGAAILIQAASREPRFRALVADCPFVSFEEIAQDRLVQNGLPARALGWPVLQLGLAYARVRYGVSLRQASPADALRHSRTPVLLIHGLGDVNIAPRHSRALQQANPAITQLWEVPRAGHVGSLGTQPGEYRGRVLHWFDVH
jgi:pimeloyl-ACP methyl ester carboxylesterase